MLSPNEQSGERGVGKSTGKASRTGYSRFPLGHKVYGNEAHGSGGPRQRIVRFTSHD